MRRTVVLVGAFALLLTAALPGGAQVGIERTDRPLPESIESLRLDSPATAAPTTISKMDPSLAGARGRVDVIVRMAGASLAEARPGNSGTASRHVRAIEASQNALIRRAGGLDANAQVLGTTQRVLNAVFLNVDAAVLGQLASDPSVVRIAPVSDYEMDLSETVPYIGGSAAHEAGFDGSGIVVAVLDSGVDYTHANLGGPGTLDAYFQAYGENPRSGKNRSVADRYLSKLLFPTDKVIGGFDFVGESWPNGALRPDPDPIDFEGHGTHVADIIAGVDGVAPGAQILALKVCSAVATSCSGVALIQAMDYAVDPNGDADTSDRVDIINMSLGSLYGQPFDDDLSAAVDGATALGVLTVASAGNSGDQPFVTGSPAAAATALSVAQTQVPSAALQLIDVTNVGSIPAVFQPWSTPVSGTITGTLQYGDGAGGNTNGCAPFTSDLTGLIVLVDRGVCNFTLKIKTISDAGGAAGIIGLIAPGAPFSGGDGGERPINIPGFMISQSASNALKAKVGTSVTIDPANVLPLIGQMVGSSSRGPQFDDLRIKPEIGAPGASVSAVAGSGTGTTPFGGTSGAAPMVSGAAAVLLQARPDLDPLRTKSLLMNNADPNIDIDPFSGIAEISRIGAGEVRVDRSLDAPVVAYDLAGYSGSLSFGFHDVAEPMALTRTLTVENLSGEARTYSVSPEHRFVADASGAVVVSAPSEVTVAPGSTQSFDVTLTIDPTLLPANALNSGSNGANGAALTAMEYDGYLVLDSGDDTLNIPWHVLPRKSARVVADTQTLTTGGFPESIGLTNTGAGAANNDAYALVALDEELPEGGRGQQSPTPDIAAVGVNTFPVPAGFCSANPSFLWAFAVSHHERQTHAIAPGIVWIDLDVDQDGTPDYAVYTYSAAGLGNIADGRVLTWTAPYVDFAAGLIGPQSAFFFAEHGTVTGNTAMYICAEQIGMGAADLLSTTVDAKAYAFDIYFGGPGDETDAFTITPLGERFVGVASDLGPSGAGTLDVYDFGAFPGNTDELGVLLFTNGDRGAGNRGAATEATEALTFLAP